MQKLITVVIEDNEDVRENIEEILELAGYEVFSAKDGKEGVLLVKKIVPDIIVCDIMMPQLDGYGVIKLLSRDPLTSSIPFIFLTAKSEKVDIRKGMLLGADDYLTKPFGQMELLEAIDARLERNRKFKEYTDSSLDGLNSFIDEAKSLSTLESLAAERKTKSFKAKERIYWEGDYSNQIYYIIKGQVKLFKTDEYGKELIVTIAKGEEFIGYTSIFGEENYIESAVALQDCQVAIIPKVDAQDLIYKNKDVGNQFLKLLAKDIEEKERKLLLLAYSNVRERTAFALLEFGKKEGSDTIKVSRENIAQIVGTAQESLIRMLSDFKKDGLIEVSGRSIKLIDIKGLKNIASNYID